MAGPEVEDVTVDDTCKICAAREANPARGVRVVERVDALLASEALEIGVEASVGMGVPVCTDGGVLAGVYEGSEFAGVAHALDGGAETKVHLLRAVLSACAALHERADARVCAQSLPEGGERGRAHEVETAHCDFIGQLPHGPACMFA